MADETTPPESADERDDLAALDFSAPEAAEESVLDVLDVYRPVDTDATESANAVVTVTNPSGTVSVSAFPDGRISGIELSAKARELTETDLADEIVVVARLAAQDAKSTQYARILAGMREQGHDDAATRDFLNRDVGLPSPEQARADRDRVFSTRYAGDHD